MSFIQVNLGEDVAEATVVDEGTYDLTAGHLSDKPSKKGRPMLTIMHTFDTEDHAAPVNVYLSFPQEGDEPNTVDLLQLSIKRYLEMAGIEYDPTGFDTDIILGASFSAYVTKDEIFNDEDQPFNPPQFRNNIKIPRLTSE